MPLLPPTLHSIAVRPRTWWTLLVIWWVTLWFLSGTAHPPSLPGFLDWDKLKHAVYFMLGGSFWALALRLQKPHLRTLIIALTGAALMTVVGFFDEWHQMFTPGRSGNDPGDWIADTIGGVLGPWVGLGCQRLLRLRPIK